MAVHSTIPLAWNILTNINVSADVNTLLSSIDYQRHFPDNEISRSLFSINNWTSNSLSSTSTSFSSTVAYTSNLPHLTSTSNTTRNNAPCYPSSNATDKVVPVSSSCANLATSFTLPLGFDLNTSPTTIYEWNVPSYPPLMTTHDNSSTTVSDSTQSVSEIPNFELLFGQAPRTNFVSTDMLLAPNWTLMSNTRNSFPTISSPSDVSLAPFSSSAAILPNSTSGNCGLQSIVTTCSNCHIQNTPQWRFTPDRSHMLCNACGLYYKTYHTHRPLHLRLRKPMTSPACLLPSPMNTVLLSDPYDHANPPYSNNLPATPSKFIKTEPISHRENDTTLSPCTSPTASGFQRTCFNCFTHQTPLWRRLFGIIKTRRGATQQGYPQQLSPNSNPFLNDTGVVSGQEVEPWLCNACALYYKLHGEHRPHTLTQHARTTKRCRLWNDETGSYEQPNTNNQAPSMPPPPLPCSPPIQPQLTVVSVDKNDSDIVNAVLRVLGEEGGRDALQTWLAGREMITSLTTVENNCREQTCKQTVNEATLQIDSRSG